MFIVITFVISCDRFVTVCVYDRFVSLVMEGGVWVLVELVHCSWVFEFVGLLLLFGNLGWRFYNLCFVVLILLLWLVDFVGVAACALC